MQTMLNVVITKYCFSHMACSVAGITSDANVLTNYLRLAAQRSGTHIRYNNDCTIVWINVYRYLLQYQEEIPCEQLVMRLCDLKQQYTQFGGNNYSLHILCVSF